MQAQQMRTDQQQVLNVGRSHCREMRELLKSLAFKENVTFWFNSAGAKVFTNDEHSNQAEIFFSPDCFSCFTVRADQVAFSLKLATLLECLSILDNNFSTFQLIYEGQGAPLHVYVEEDGVVIEGKIPTLEENLNNLEFDLGKSIIDVFMKPDILKDTIRDLDPKSQQFAIKFSPKRIVFGCKGELGKAYTVFPHDSDEIEQYECDANGDFSYRAATIKRLMTALHQATRVRIQIDNRGVLNIQLQAELTDAVEQPFIEFKCLCLTPFDEEPT
ncbi:unnamed protein product, partial [Mesorhabditis belari]|uniref:Cell cycle checkpoint protein RAD1 n=1 Tax=Mesorhabditis belari TaxID=2138241 RepID=A0AAF3FP87_9BILA